MKFAGLALLLLSTTSAFALGGEGSVSSGGELFRDAKNPWFVRSRTENPYTVRYCIQVDQASFSMPEAQLRAEIAYALNYWKGEFSRSLGGTDLQIATQNFVETECISGTADLTFKFGYGALTTDDINFLKTPSRYIGVSVRTAYDPVELRAKGYVFISSDLGPNAYDNTGALIEHAWKYPELVRYTLLHETGHLFGLTHSGDGLMSEVFFDQILNRALYEVFLHTPVETFFAPPNPMDVCLDAETGPGPTGPGKSWLGVPTEATCIRVVKVDEHNYQVRYQQGSDWKDAGALHITQKDIFDMRDRPAVLLHLNPEQKIFTEREARFRSFVEGPWFVDYGAEALYTPVAAPAPKSARVRITSGSFQLVGQLSGKLIVPFNYNSLIGAKMSLPPLSRR